MALFREGQRLCAARGLILVDTKYEFGKTADGQIVVIDEIHTPDSSRFWYSASYESRFEAGQDPESFDKEYVRRYLVDQNYRGDGLIPVIPDGVRVEAMRRYIEGRRPDHRHAVRPELGRARRAHAQKPGPKLACWPEDSMTTLPAVYIVGAARTPIGSYWACLPACPRRVWVPQPSAPLSNALG